MIGYLQKIRNISRRIKTQIGLTSYSIDYAKKIFNALNDENRGVSLVCINDDNIIVYYTGGDWLFNIELTYQYLTDVSHDDLSDYLNNKISQLKAQTRLKKRWNEQ